MWSLLVSSIKGSDFALVPKIPEMSAGRLISPGRVGRQAEVQEILGWAGDMAEVSRECVKNFS